MENLRQTLAPRAGGPLEPEVRVSRLDSFDGTRDVVVLQTWPFTAREVILVPLRDAAGLSARAGPGDAQVFAQVERKAIRVAATYFRGSALIWWIGVVSANSPPDTWDVFQREVELQFAPPNAVRQARDELAALTQTGEVSEYCDRFNHIVLRVPGITQDEMPDRFVRGLKRAHRIEVLKACVDNVSDAMRVALSVESALSIYPGVYVETRGRQVTPFGHGQGPVPMELGLARAGPAGAGRGLVARKHGSKC
ncbi:hypothetical protein FVE85_4607 [Porphyridium purpureum]|uniref:Retrotransposon gag domain-containing protein n=1 Tax=Porphyridium purpureum TaxID=35688 RepID=A0A5J4YRB3_PORPP|nr:hypothetical protein FVE85_4607 [Porphyridium purpureum]|eukprot:POR9307..scf236_6